MPATLTQCTVRCIVPPLEITNFEHMEYIMKNLLIGLTLLASMSSFAASDVQLDDYSLKIQEEDQRMVDRIVSRIELSRVNEGSDCVQTELNKIENDVQAAKMKYGEQMDDYSEKMMREDLQIVARIKARTCLYLE